MKTVIAPVDFSETATNALHFAADLSRRASARLVIVHIGDDDDDIEDAKTKIKALETNVKQTFGPSVNTQTVVEQGDLVPVLNQVATAHQADLIVMGTKGASGLKRILIGSNTVKLIAKTNIPFRY